MQRLQPRQPHRSSCSVSSAEWNSLLTKEDKFFFIPRLEAWTRTNQIYSISIPYSVSLFPSTRRVVRCVLRQGCRGANNTCLKHPRRRVRLHSSWVQRSPSRYNLRYVSWSTKDKLRTESYLVVTCNATGPRANRKELARNLCSSKEKKRNVQHTFEVGPRAIRCYVRRDTDRSSLASANPSGLFFSCHELPT